jgi:hypothetical protein
MFLLAFASSFCFVSFNHSCLNYQLHILREVRFKIYTYNSIILLDFKDKMFFQVLMAKYDTALK